MKGFSMFLAGLAVAAAFYFGYIFITGKSFGTNPFVPQTENPGKSEEAASKEKLEKMKAEELREQQRKLMEERQRTFRNNRDRN